MLIFEEVIITKKSGGSEYRAWLRCWAGLSENAVAVVETFTGVVECYSTADFYIRFTGSFKNQGD